MVEARGPGAQAQPNSSGGGRLQPPAHSAWSGGPPNTQGMGSSRGGRGGRGPANIGSGHGRGGGRGGGKPQAQQPYGGSQRSQSSQPQRPVAEAVTAADFGANFGGEYELAAAQMPMSEGQGPQHSRYGLDRTENSPQRQQQQQQGTAQSGSSRSDLAAASTNGGAQWGSVAGSAPLQQQQQHSLASISAPSSSQGVEEHLLSVRAEMGRLAAVEADLQRRLDEQSEAIKLKAEVAAHLAEIADLKEERASLRANSESERRSFVAQLQEKDAELERLKREAWGKDEAIRERDVKLMEVSKKQSDSDSNMAAAMEEINSAQARLNSREEEMEKAAADKEGEYKAREAELLSAINEWQRMVHSKEEAIWHMQAVHASEKSNIEAHYMHQINRILAEKHALAEEVTQLKGGSSEGATVRTSTPPMGMPVMMPPVTGAPMPGPHAPVQPEQQQPQQQQQQEGGLNWIESLMNGSAHKQQQQQQQPATSHPPANAWGKEEGHAHHPSLDPRVPRPNTGHHSGFMPNQASSLGDGNATVRLLTDHELVALMKRLVPQGPEAARPWSTEDEMNFEDMLAPFNWADHYGPQHGSVMDFLLSNQDVFGMLPDGCVYSHHPIPAANPVIPPPFPKKVQPVFGTVSPGGIPSPVGTPAARAASAAGPGGSGRLATSAVVVTPMPSITNTNASAEGRSSAPNASNSSSGPKTVIHTVVTSGQHGGARSQGGSGKPRAEGESKGRPDSRSRSRRGGQGRNKDK